MSIALILIKYYVVFILLKDIAKLSKKMIYFIVFLLSIRAHISFRNTKTAQVVGTVGYFTSIAKRACWTKVLFYEGGKK